MLKFAKMHGLGNDFMVLDLVSQDYTPNAAQICAWADRHTGVGFDQLLTVEPPNQPDVDFRSRSDRGLECGEDPGLREPLQRKQGFGGGDDVTVAVTHTDQDGNYR